MWLERRNERGKWVFDTVETLTLHIQPKISLQIQREAPMTNESDTHFLIITVFHGGLQVPVNGLVSFVQN